MVAQGKVTTVSRQDPYGWYHPWSDTITLSPDAMLSEPLTPIHEIGHRHQTMNVGGKWFQPLGAFDMLIGSAWGAASKLYDNHVRGQVMSQGFVENVVQSWAQKIANACGIKY